MQLFHRCARFVALLGLALTGLAAAAAAQQTLEGKVRIGVIVPAVPAAGADPLAAAVARSAEHGAVIAEEEFQFNAELIGVDFAVLQEKASGAAVVAAADKLVADGAYSIIGGFTTEEAAALGAWAKAKGVPYFNVGAQADSLRNDRCSPMMFHLEPSAGMYLDAYVGWYVRSGFRRWYFVREDSAEGKAQYDRIRWSMQERHFGAREAGQTVLRPGASGGTALVNAVRQSGADVIMLLLSAQDQLRILGELDRAGIRVATTGFPHPEAQTRAFLAQSAAVAPNIGTGHRASSWEATIDAYGAREYNARYRLRWKEPKEAPAWAIFHAVKILYESALAVGSTNAKDIVAHFRDRESVFDLHKGIGVSFRPWDQQLRQSLYLIKILAKATPAAEGALLVGELPAIYLPGTNLVERLDQLGDLAGQSRCKF